MNQSSNAGSMPFMWSHEYLVRLLSTGKNPIVTDPILLNAFRTIDRADFVHERFKDIAHQDKVVDLGYGEVMTNPTTIASQLQIFAPRYGGRYLHLGTGTGYVAALLAFVAGDKGHVYSMERIQWLWEQARSSIQNYPQIQNLSILYRDGSDGLQDKSPFDGILYSLAISDIPEIVINQLGIGAKLVAPSTEHTLRVITRTSVTDFEEEIVHGYSMFNYKEQKQGVA